MTGTSGNGQHIDFGLNIAQRSRAALRGMRFDVAQMANDTERTRKAYEEINRLIDKRAEREADQLTAVERLNDTLDRTRRLATIVTSLYLIKQAFDAVVDAGESFDQQIIKSRIAFGSFDNALRGYKYFQDQVAAGKLFGAPEDFMEASQILMRKGIHMTEENINLLNDWGAAAGKSANEVASAIESAIEGNTAAFEEFGISERTMRRFSLYATNTTQMRDAVMGFVKAQKQFTDAAATAPVTWERIFQRMKAMKDQFIQSIVGFSGDPNSLQSTVKREIMNVLDFLHKNAKFFTAIAGTIAAVTKFIASTIGQFVRWVISGTQKKIDAMSGFVNNWKERVAGFILYLELIKLRIIDFYTAHEKTIKMLVKWFFYYKAAKMALAIGMPIINSVGMFIDKMRILYLLIRNSNTLAALSGAFQGVFYALADAFPLIARLGTALRGLFLLMTGPVGWAIAAATVVILLLNIKKVRDTVYDLLGWFGKMPGILKLSFFPLTLTLAFIRSVLKNWQQIKATIVNVAVILRNVFVLTTRFIGSMLTAIGKGVVRFFSTLWEIMPDWVKNFGKWIMKGISSAASGIARLWDKLVPDWLKDLFKTTEQMFDKIIQFFYKGSTFLADATGAAVQASGGKGWGATVVDKDGKLTKSMTSQGLNYLNSSPVVAPTQKSGSSTSNSMIVQPGAVNINTTGGDPKEIGRQVEESLKKMQRDNFRKGINK